MDFETKSDALSCLNPNALLADGYDKALIGVVKIHGEFVALYDSDICLDILTQEQQMEDEEVLEYFEYNTLGSYMGPHTPAFTSYGYEEDSEFTVLRADGSYAPKNGDIALFEEEN